MLSKCSVVILLLAFQSANSYRVKRYTQEQCGEPFNAGGLIQHGTLSPKDKWPYLAALFGTVERKFFCAGSLISTNHVLTAAHCLQPKPSLTSKQPAEVIAYLGKYDLNVAHERGSVPAYPTEFFIHPDWQPLEPRYDADIAIIKLEDQLPIRSNIYPVCLWTLDLNVLREDDGTVVGWGTSENQGITEHENLPHEVNLTIVSNEKCYEDEHLAKVISYRTFCAGGDNRGPCRGDSGGGLFTNRGTKHYIRGIVSSSLFRTDGSCDVNRYSVFTNVAKFTKWINGVLGVKIELNCDYSAGDRYYCRANNLKIVHENIRIADTHGNHVGNRENNDVTELVIHNQYTPYLPALISDIFPNMIKYFAGASSLKFIERINFDGLSHLTQIEFGVNNIEKIPKDTFYGLPYLESLLLHNNKIEALHRDTFINNINLREIYIYGNKIEFLDQGLFRNNMKLEGLHIDNNRLQFIESNLFENNKNLKQANFQSNVCLSEHFPNSVNLMRLKEVFARNCKV